MNALTLYVLVIMRGAEPAGQAFLFPSHSACVKQMASLEKLPQDWHPYCLPVQNKAEAVK